MKQEKQPEVVVITGGSAGLGRAMVRKFAMAGAKIGIIARNCQRLEQTREEVEAIGSEAFTVSADVSNAQSVENAAEAVEEALGPVDIWINNAMVSVFSPFEHVTAEEFRRVTEVTYLGYVNGTMAALRRMTARDHGTILQVGSSLACRGMPLQSAYCGAQHAIRGFTDSISLELAHEGSNVHITMVHLPAMNTPQFDWVRSTLPFRAQPVAPVYQPEVGADAVFWAAHIRRGHVYVGAGTVTDLATNRLAPGLRAKRLAENNYRALRTGEPEDLERPDNLYEPVPGDYEAHGRFDGRARNSSSLLWLAKNRQYIGWALLAASLAGIGGSLVIRKRANPPGPRIDYYRKTRPESTAGRRAA